MLELIHLWIGANDNMILRPLWRLALHRRILLSLIHGDDLHTSRLNSIWTRLSSTGERAGDLLQLFFLRAGDDLDNIATERR